MKEGTLQLIPKKHKRSWETSNYKQFFTNKFDDLGRGF